MVMYTYTSYIIMGGRGISVMYTHLCIILVKGEVGMQDIGSIDTFCYWDIMDVGIISFIHSGLGLQY